MRFIVTRTSASNEKPCDGAEERIAVWVDRRDVADPREIPAFRDQDVSWWYGVGTNHRVENGKIVRNLDTETMWTVEVEDVAALMRFIDTYGKVVVSPASDSHYECDGVVLPEIEIYDDWRE